MLHITFSLSYKHVPFKIEIDAVDIDAIDQELLGKIIDQVKHCIDQMLKQKPSLKTNEYHR